MSLIRNSHVLNDLRVSGGAYVSSNIDLLTAGTMKLGDTISTKVEIASSGVITEVKGSANILIDANISGSLAVVEPSVIGRLGVANTSAILEIDSTTQGVLFPRMSSAQRTSILSPSAGLLVYDTTEKTIYYYNGVSWVELIKNNINNTNIIIGEESAPALGPTNNNNIVVGKTTASLLTDDNNIILGNASMPLATSTQSNIIIGSGSASAMLSSDTTVILGHSGGNSITTGVNNVCLGDSSGATITTGSNNVMIGPNTSGASTLSNQVCLGHQAVSDKSNQIMLGNAGTAELVPNATASANLGTSTNPWNDINIKGSITISSGGLINNVNIVSLSNGVVKRTIINTSTYTALSTDVILSCKYSTTNIQTITLPLSSTVDPGKTYHIVDTGGNAYVYNITINMSGSDTINGSPSILINGNYQSYSIYNEGSGNWYVF